MITCPKCSTENHFEGAVFCRTCGEKLRETVVATVSSQQTVGVGHAGSIDNTTPFEHPTADKDSLIDSVEEIEIESTQTNDVDSKEDINDQLLEKSSDIEPEEPIEEVSDIERAGSLEIESPSDFLIREQTVEEANAQFSTEEEMIPAADSVISSEAESSLTAPDETAADEDQRHDESEGSITETDRVRLINSLSQVIAPATITPVTEQTPLDVGDDFADDKSAQQEFREEHDHSETADPNATTARIGFASLYGRKLSFPEQVKPKPGDSITYNDQKFVIRKGKLDRKSWILGSVFGILVLTVLLVQAFSGANVPKAMLFGVVTDSETGQTLAGVTITLPRTGASTATNQSGTFRFADMENGRYDIKIESALHEARFFPLTIEDNKSEMLIASLSPLIPFDESMSEVAITDEQTAEAPPQPTVGTLRIKCNLEDAVITVNGKTLGKGSRTFRRMKLGNHLLVIKRDDYQDFEQKITIAPGKTSEVIAILIPEQEEKSVEYTAADYFAQAEDFFKKKNYTEAIGYYTLALARDPSMVAAYLHRADANQLKGNKLNARSDLRSAADIYMNAAQYKRAVECYGKIIKLSPRSVEAYQMRGWAKIYSGDYQSGIEDMKKALDLDSKNWRVRFEYGRALHATNNYKDAEKHLKKIQKHGEEAPEILAFLALTKLSRGNDSDARKYYRKFLKFASSAQIARMSAVAGWQRLTAAAEAGN